MGKGGGIGKAFTNTLTSVVTTGGITNLGRLAGGKNRTRADEVDKLGNFLNSKETAYEPIKNYVSPEPVEPDNSQAEAEARKLFEEQEARKRARRFGKSLLASDTATGTTLGV